MSDTVITKQVIHRMKKYLDCLKNLPSDKLVNITAETLAAAADCSVSTVRQDLYIVSNGEIPDVGYIVEYLITDLEHHLGYDQINHAVLVGAGNIGHALMAYDGFAQYGVEIVVAFDKNSSLWGTTVGSISIFPLEKLHDLCQSMPLKIGIITVPAFSAQEVCDILIENGIKAIWNFAPIVLNVPNDVMVINENIAASLSILSQYLAQKY